MARKKPIAGRRLDPVCHKAVVPDDLFSLKHRGTTYWFCSTRCLSRFRVWPECYLATAPPLGWGVRALMGSMPVSERVYTCDVKTEGAFQDPVCRMVVGPDSPHRLEYHDMVFRFCSARCLRQFKAGQ
jgi:YHS domain-containing protein